MLDQLPPVLAEKNENQNPTINGQWENRYDVQFSSLSEAISSILIKNIESKQDFD